MKRRSFIGGIFGAALTLVSGIRLWDSRKERVFIREVMTVPSDGPAHFPVSFVRECRRMADTVDQSGSWQVLGLEGKGVDVTGVGLRCFARVRLVRPKIGRSAYHVADVFGWLKRNGFREHHGDGLPWEV